MAHGRRILMPLLAWLCLTAPTAAHPILIHAGSLAWSDDAVRLSLTLEPHSLQHESLALGNSIARGRLMIELAKSIHILNEQGETLTRSRPDLSDDGLTTTCDYVISREETTLVLLHDPGDTLGGISRQFRLAWTRDNPELARVLRLTSGGNHVVLRKPNAADRTDVHRAPFNEPVLRILADRDTPAQQVLLDFPCTLLTLWEGLIKTDDNTLTAQEFAQSRDTLAEWAQANISITDDTRVTSPATIVSAGLIDPAGKIIAETDAATRSIYTTRVRFRLQAPETECAWTGWTWTGFKAAIPSLPVVIEGDTLPRRLGVLTSAQATARIEQTSPFSVRIGRTPLVTNGSEEPQDEASLASIE